MSPSQAVVFSHPLRSPRSNSLLSRARNRLLLTRIKIKESDFYEPFAEWLKNDLDEVTEVVSPDGAGLKSKIVEAVPIHGDLGQSGCPKSIASSLRHHFREIPRRVTR